MAEAGQHDSGRDAEHEHEHIGIEAAASVSAARRKAATQQVRSTRAFRLSHPHPQASGLVVLQLEQVQHLVQPPGDQHERAERGGDQADRDHLRRSFAAASRGCSSRNRRATALNWPGESA